MAKFKAGDNILDKHDGLKYKVMYAGKVYVLLAEDGEEYGWLVGEVEQDCELIPPVKIGGKYVFVKQDSKDTHPSYMVPIAYKENSVAYEIYIQRTGKFAKYGSLDLMSFLKETKEME